MSYARGDPYRSSVGSLESPRDGGGGGGRWDSDRFNRERDRVERGGGRFVEDRDRLQVGGGRFYEERDHIEEDYGDRRPGPRFEAPNRRRERSMDPRFTGGRSRLEDDRFSGGRRDPYFYEQDFESSQTTALVPVRSGGIIHNRRPSVGGYGPPSGGRGSGPRPGIIRRQSSLDSFDRRPLPRRDDHLSHRQPINAPLPPRPVPRRRFQPSEYEERDYEEIRIAEPDYYGDDNYRQVRERDVVRTRTRETERPGYTRRSEEEFEEIIETERPFPRRGKTKMPSRLVEKSAIIALGYPFEEDGETVIILKALDKDRIDEIVRVSDEVRKSSTTYSVQETRLLEAPPSPSSGSDRRTEILIPAKISHGSTDLEVIRQVTDTHGSHSHRSERKHGRKRSKSHSHGAGGGGHSKHSHRRGHSTHGGRKHRTKSRRGSSASSSSSSSSDSSTEVDVTKIISLGESSNSVRGPLELVLPERRKDDRDIKNEIRALERDEKILKLERKAEKEERRARRYREGQEYIEVAQGGVVVEKNRKGKMSLVR